MSLLSILEEQRDELVQYANSLAGLVPWVLQTHTPVHDVNYVFAAEGDPGTLYQRTMNSFALCAVIAGEDGVANIGPPIIPEFRTQDDDDDDNEYWLVGVASSLVNGPRRACRAVSGYTPLIRGRSNQMVWQMQTPLLAARVRTPYMGEVLCYGCRIPCVIFRSAQIENVQYGALNADRLYRDHWAAAQAVWAVENARGNASTLRTWHDVDLAGPRPWFMSKWTMTVLRLEHAQPPTHPEDPHRSAMLGYCRREVDPTRRRAPATEDEWRGIPLAECQSDDDEDGDVSDAASMVDDPSGGMPTSSSWDPVTRKSRDDPVATARSTAPMQIALQTWALRPR